MKRTCPISVWTTSQGRFYIRTFLSSNMSLWFQWRLQLLDSYAAHLSGSTLQHLSQLEQVHFYYLIIHPFSVLILKSSLEISWAVKTGSWLKLARFLRCMNAKPKPYATNTWVWQKPINFRVR